VTYSGVLLTSNGDVAKLSPGYDTKISPVPNGPLLPLLTSQHSRDESEGFVCEHCHRPPTYSRSQSRDATRSGDNFQSGDINQSRDTTDPGQIRSGGSGAHNGGRGDNYLDLEDMEEQVPKSSLCTDHSIR